MDFESRGAGAPHSPKSKAPGLAVASLVLGIVSVALSCLFFISLPCAVLSLLFGLSVRRSGSAGWGFSGAGMACASFALLINVVLLVLFAALPQMNALLPLV